VVTDSFVPSATNSVEHHTLACALLTPRAAADDQIDTNGVRVHADLPRPCVAGLIHLQVALGPALAAWGSAWAMFRMCQHGAWLIEEERR
jgi:hypothetical protein